VNLVNQSGHEKPIKLAFEEVVKRLSNPRVKYVYFDFHAECSKMRWGRISLLLDRLKDEMMKQQYFQPHSSANVGTLSWKVINLSKNKRMLFVRTVWIV
jgi:phosphatidylinositol 4-phosphatase